MRSEGEGEESEHIKPDEEEQEAAVVHGCSALGAIGQTSMPCKGIHAHQVASFHNYLSPAIYPGPHLAVGSQGALCWLPCLAGSMKECTLEGAYTLACSVCFPSLLIAFMFKGTCVRPVMAS